VILTVWHAQLVRLVRSRVILLQLPICQIALRVSSAYQEPPPGTPRTSSPIHTAHAQLVIGAQLVPQNPQPALLVTSQTKREPSASTTASSAHQASCVRPMVSQSPPAPSLQESELMTVSSKTSCAAAPTVSTVLLVRILLSSATQASTKTWLAKASAKNALLAPTASTAPPKTVWPATTAPESINYMF